MLGGKATDPPGRPAASDPGAPVDAMPRCRTGSQRAEPIQSMPLENSSCRVYKKDARRELIIWSKTPDWLLPVFERNSVGGSPKPPFDAVVSGFVVESFSPVRVPRATPPTRESTEERHTAPRVPPASPRWNVGRVRPGVWCPRLQGVGHRGRERATAPIRRRRVGETKTHFAAGRRDDEGSARARHARRRARARGGGKAAR